MGLVLIVAPLVLIALAAAALAPVRPVRRRVRYLLVLLLAIGGFMLWCSANGFGTGAVVVAPAVAVALMRLLIDAFTEIAERMDDSVDDEPADQSS